MRATNRRVKSKAQMGKARMKPQELIPERKARREFLVSKLVTAAFAKRVAGEHGPSHTTFGVPVQNDENDLDCKLETACGPRFAPERPESSDLERLQSLIRQRVDGQSLRPTVLMIYPVSLIMSVQ